MKYDIKCRLRKMEVLVRWYTTTMGHFKLMKYDIKCHLLRMEKFLYSKLCFNRIFSLRRRRKCAKNMRYICLNDISMNIMLCDWHFLFASLLWFCSHTLSKLWQGCYKLFVPCTWTGGCIMDVELGTKLTWTHLGSA